MKLESHKDIRDGRAIAVLSNNNIETVDWLSSQILLALIDISNRLLIRQDGQRYILINSKEQALGLEFVGYIIAPSYQTLEDVVKMRIR